MTTVTMATFPSASEIETVKRTNKFLQALGSRTPLADRREHVRDLIAAWVGGTTQVAKAIPVSSEALAADFRFDEQNGSTLSIRPPDSQEKRSATVAPVIWGEGTCSGRICEWTLARGWKCRTLVSRAAQAFSVGTWFAAFRPLESKDEDKRPRILSAADAGQNQRGCS